MKLKELFENTNSIDPKIRKEILNFQSELIDQGWDDVLIKFQKVFYPNQRQIVHVELIHNNKNRIKLIGHIYDKPSWDSEYLINGKWEHVYPDGDYTEGSLSYCQAYLNIERLRSQIKQYEIYKEKFEQKGLSFSYDFMILRKDHEVKVSIIHSSGNNCKLEGYKITALDQKTDKYEINIDCHNEKELLEQLSEIIDV